MLINFYGRAGQLGRNFYFAPADETGGAGGGAGTGESGQNQQSGQQANNQQGGQQGNQNSGGEKTFTQSDVDRIVKDRIARANAQKDNEWGQKLEGLSPEEIAEFKEFKANRQKTIDEELAKNKKFEEALNRVNTAAAKEKQALQKDLNSMKTRLEKTLTKNAIFGVLSKHKLVERAPAQIAGLIEANLRVKDLDSGEIEVVGHDGGFLPDSRGIPHTLETFIEAWLSENPHFLVGTGGGAGYNPAKGGKQTFSRSQLRDPAFYEANREAILAAQKEGRITDN